MFLAQTITEYGLVDSIGAGLATARDRIELYIGPGNLKYVLIALLVILVLLVTRRRRI